MNAREQLRQDWEARIADYKASGLTMAAWCKANHFKIDQLKYWLYKAKQPSSPSPAQSPTRFSNGAEPRLKKSGFGQIKASISRIRAGTIDSW